VSAQAVWYDETATEPALLSSNREIRHEAGQIYYLGNTFNITIRDFHPRILLRLKGRLKHVSVNWERFWRAATLSDTHNGARGIHGTISNSG
jgi:hypothetical protein